MPPRQATLHMYLDSDAPHRSALLGIRALARLRSPLANHIRERARRYISSMVQRSGSAGFPIVLDHTAEDNDSTVARMLPLELECPICRSQFVTPIVLVIFANIALQLTLLASLNCGHSFCLTHVLAILCNASASNNDTPVCPTCRSAVFSLPPVNFSLRDCVDRWLGVNGFAEEQGVMDAADQTEGLRILRLFFRRV